MRAMVFLSAEIAAHRRGRRVFANGAPQNIVQRVVVVLVRFVEIHARRRSRGRGVGIPLVQGDARLLGGVRGRVGLALERRRHDARPRVEVRHGLQAEQEFDGAQHRRGVIHGAVHGVALHPGRNQKRRRAVRIHVVRPVLRVVFQHANHRRRPEARFRDALHQHADGVVVVRRQGKRRQPPGRDAVGVIVAHPHDDEARHVAGLLVFRQLAEESLGALHVGVGQVEAAIHPVGHFGQHRVAHARRFVPTRMAASGLLFTM